MRSFSKKLAFVLAAALVLTGFAPAAQAKAADDFSLNRTSYILYTNEDSVNMHGSEYLADGLYGNVSSYDFNLKNKPADWNTAYSYKWASSDAKIATVATGGVVTAKSVGKTVISCTITEKATGNVAATLKADVQVKANAADIEIYAADGNDYDGVKVAPGKYDFNRNMFDEAGNKTNKQGTYVTDYTKWVVDPANAGVTVDQSNGVVTVSEDANGEFTLYAYTYQSDKYNQATATSNKVVFTVGDSTFDVKQKDATKFTVTFDAPVKALATSDVTMVKRLELATMNYDYPVAIKAVELAKDGLSADVTLFDSNPFTHNTKYIISVKGYEDLPFTASLGNPTRIEISAKDALGGEVLTTGKQAEILVTYYDEKDVVVTPVNPTVIFRLEERSTDGSFYLAGKNLTIKKEGVAATVIAEYQGRIENGKRVGQLDTKRTFVAVNQAPVVISGLAGASVIGFDWPGPSTTMRLGDKNKVLQVKFTKTDGKTYGPYTSTADYEATFDNYKLSYTALTPATAVISNAGVITPFKTGTATFYVNLAEKQSNGAWGTANPVAVVDVTIQADATFAYTTIDNNGSITLGTNTSDKTFYTGEFKLSAVDSYGDAWEIKNKADVKIECVTDGYEKTDFADAVKVDRIADKKAVITADADAILTVLKAKKADLKEGEAAILFFSATYEKYTVEFSVMIQVPGAEAGNYIQIAASANSVDALRVKDDNKTAAKDISFEVFWMNNAVKVGKLDLVKCPASASAVSEGTYCYKVTKDGKDLETNPVGNKVTVALSYNEKDDKGVDIVKYLGDGSYEFALYRCYGEGADAVLVQEYSSVIDVYVSGAGTYYVAGDLVNNKVDDGTDAAKILACFNINDRNNKPVLKDGAKNGEAKYDLYKVYSTPVADAGYVYVEKITFYESVGEAYVPYTVYVDTVLQIGK